MIVFYSVVMDATVPLSQGVSGGSVVEMNVERDIPFPFRDGRFPPSLGAVVQRTVASGERPALVVIHDDENDWIVQDGVTDPTGPGASIIQHIAHVVERDPSVGRTANLPLGHVAWRRRREDSSTVDEWAYDDE